MLGVRSIYRGREGMWAWLLHRVSGVGILFFLLLHIVDTALVGFGPEAYNFALSIYHLPPFRVLQVILGGAILYHGLNGIRITLIDFSSRAIRWQREIFYGEIVLFLTLFLPTAYIMMRPVLLPGW